MARSQELEAGLDGAQAAEQEVRAQAANLEPKRQERRSAAVALETQQGELDRDRQHLLEQMAWRA